MILAESLVLAHRGEEVLFVAVPLLIIFGLLAMSARRRSDERDDEDE